MEKVGAILEMRAGEGGDDAKLLVQRQYAAYARYMQRQEISVEPIHAVPGGAGG